MDDNFSFANTRGSDVSSDGGRKLREELMVKLLDVVREVQEIEKREVKISQGLGCAIKDKVSVDSYDLVNMDIFRIVSQLHGDLVVINRLS